MDYIREELLRQRAALSRLLLGRTEVEEREEQNESVWADENRDDSVLLAGAEAFFASRKLADRERLNPQGERTGSTETGYRDASDGFWEEAAGEVPAFAWSRTADGHRALRRGRAERVFTTRDGTVVRGTEAGSLSGAERTVLETVWADEEKGTDARELSRIFQRDARRYDGGFTLY